MAGDITITATELTALKNLTPRQFVEALRQRRCDFHGVVVEGDLNLCGATVEGDLNLNSATVGGGLNLNSATVGGGLNLGGATVEGEIFCGENPVLALQFFLYFGGRVHVNTAILARLCKNLLRRDG